MKNKIPLAKPYLGREELSAVSKVIASDTLSLGPKLIEFEGRFAKFIGTKHAIAVNSGTSGLHLCIKALQIRSGDEVITTPFSFVASSNPIVIEGARPVFVDIDEETYNINPDKLAEAITDKTRAILLVHLFGRPCNMEAIMKIAVERKISLIEDACEALGTTYDGRKVGSFGKAAVFAFYPNKQITTGEGGIITTDNDEIARLCRSLRNQGRDDSSEWLNHVRIGYNYRLNEMSCALGIEQLKKINFILKKRKEIAARYTECFGKAPELITPGIDSRAEISWWVYFLRLRDSLNRNRIIEYLNKNGVSSRAYFDPPIHLQPVYKQIFGYRGGEFPIAEKVAGSGFIVPFFVSLSNREIKRVCDTVIKAIRSLRK